ncbi:hypothetical protein PT277_08625 [Acetobacteraceae bacterium ESL0709]|nr:hypothetical protein [Acetobacteraceae bacterium ESL0697]MDF7678747.1 hypothetical protein [Acetobacteraceae bacterium ESL0709]
MNRNGPIILSFLLILSPLPSLAKPFDYCAKERITTMYYKTLSQVVPHWTKMALESGVVVGGRDLEIMHNRLAGKGPGRVVFDYSRMGKYEDYDGYDPDNDASLFIKEIGKSLYIAHRNQGSAECITDDLIIRIDDICTNFHEEGVYASAGYVEFGYIHKKPYIYYILFFPKGKLGSYVRFYSLDKGNVRLVCQKEYTLKHYPKDHP